MIVLRKPREDKDFVIPMQREALLTNAAMTITQLTKECDPFSTVTG